MKPPLPTTDKARAAAVAWGAGPDTPEGAVINALADMVDEVTQTVAGLQGLDLAKIEAMHNRAAKSCLQDAAKTFVRTRHWRATAIIAGVIAFALMAGGAGGYLVGRQSPAPMTATWQSPAHESCSIHLSTTP